MALSRPSVLAIIPGFVPSTIIDVVQPMIDLDRAGIIRFQVALEYMFRKKDLEKADLVIFCRNAEPKYRAILDTVQACRIPYIYDIDDNLFEIPTDTEIGRYYRSPERQEMLTRFIKGADIVRVYSGPLLERCKALNEQTEKITAPVDWRLIKSSRPPAASKIKIVYVTSRAEDKLSSIFLPALKDIHQEYGDRVEIYFWGSEPGDVRSLPFVHFLRPVFNYNQFLSRFAQYHFDIGLAPLLNDTFHRSKTNNKFREYGACRIAGIYSDVDVYNSCVVDGKTGLLVQNEPQCWQQALRRLIEDDLLRRQIQEQAYQYTRQHYNQDVFIAVWKEQIRLALQSSPAKAVSSNAGQAVGPNVSPTAQTGRAGTVLGKLKNLGGKGLAQYVQRSAYNIWTMLKVNLLKTL